MLFAVTQITNHALGLTYFRAIVIGLVQGVTELFPVSSLGHSVLLPDLFGWHDLVKSQSQSESGFLAFLVGLHVASALALLVFFWRDWARIISAFFASIGKRKIETSSERLAWLIVIASIPPGILGLAFEHTVRSVLARPTAAAVFLTINGFILLGGERARRRSAVRELAAKQGATPEGSRRLDTLDYREAGIIGAFQSLALIAGISRDGITMAAGLVRGLNNEDAAKFAFLLATPLIFAAGVYKAHDLLGANGAGIRGQVVAGSLVTFFAALVTLRFLVRYFKTRTLTPFGIYCLIFGVFMIVWSSIKG